MTLSNQQKFLILVVAVALLLYFMNKDNENYQTVSSDVSGEELPIEIQISDSKISSALDQLVANGQNIASTQLSALEQKMLGKNSVHGADVKVSYSTDARPSNRTDAVLDDFFARGNTITNVDTNNDLFEPLEDTNKSLGDSYAPVNLGKKVKQTPNDIYNLDNFLPKQVNEDWFDNVPEPISVKNRYLINVSKQVGVNTIGSSHKNASWDLRGEEYCPKFVVSPWMQSSIEPDTSLVGLCGKQ